jgi:hypothetical protein
MNNSRSTGNLWAADIDALQVQIAESMNFNTLGEASQFARRITDIVAKQALYQQTLQSELIVADLRLSDAEAEIKALKHYIATIQRPNGVST